MRCVVLLCVVLCALALGPSRPAHADDAFGKWVEALWPEAAAMGISRATFDAAFKGVTLDLTLPDLLIPGREKEMKGQAEFIRPPKDYLNKGYLQKLAEQGKALLKQHAATLAKIEKEIGVDRQVVLAIWGRETAYATYTLPHYGIKALATQAYYGRRKDMFRKELLYALKLLEDRILTVATMRSSWAGAMGLPQFMPSEYYEYAYDLDGDGKKDIWNSIPDSLASAAKQLKGKGWIFGLAWGIEVKLPAGTDCAFEGPQQARTIAEWSKLGVAPVAAGRGFRAEEGEQQAYLMSPAGAFGPSFLVTENFSVIRRYNTSDLYAVFVGHLADRIAGGGDFQTPWRDVPQLSTSDLEEVQRRLQERGYPIDKLDGKIGSNTRSQAGLYQRNAKMTVDCWPSQAVLGKLRSPAPK